MPQPATDVEHDSSCPLGASVGPRGVNFSVYSKNASAVELLLLNGADEARPAKVIVLEPPNLPLLACHGAGARGRTDLRLPRARSVNWTVSQGTANFVTLIWFE